MKLSDGRHLAYQEFGFPKEEARYKIIVVHGYGSSKDTHLPVSQVRTLLLLLLFCLLYMLLVTLAKKNWKSYSEEKVDECK